jgi:hypothetical protein
MQRLPTVYFNSYFPYGNQNYIYRSISMPILSTLRCYNTVRSLPNIDIHAIRNLIGLFRERESSSTDIFSLIYHIYLNSTSKTNVTNPSYRKIDNYRLRLKECIILYWTIRLILISHLNHPQADIAMIMFLISATANT